jgi:hypothetical protein
VPCNQSTNNTVVLDEKNDNDREKEEILRSAGITIVFVNIRNIRCDAET